MRRVILAVCATAAALVLLLSFKTHPQPGIGTSPAAALGTPAPGSGGAGNGTASLGTAPAGAKTVAGAAWPTVYGPVQVQVAVAAGKVAAVRVLQYPAGTPRDVEINAYAIPRLNSEALAAGSASIDAVSGATYTSQGYIASLQNALHKARSA